MLFLPSPDITLEEVSFNSHTKRHGDIWGRIFLPGEESGYSTG